MSSKHQAILLSQEREPQTIVERNTPRPGPNEVLIEVKAIAVNPVDQHQRDSGTPPVSQYPTVLGCDVAGVVAEVGSDLTKTGPNVGSRVVAFASGFFNDAKPDYGAFQQYVLVPSEGVAALPDAISFEDGAVIPLAALTALTAYTTIDISLDTKHSPSDKEAILIWGASSSVGTFAVQSAKSMGFVVYATASSHNHDYIKKLGADRVFDYKDVSVVSNIIEAVQKDGTKLTTANCVVAGALQPTLDVLKITKGNSAAKVAHTPLLPEGHPELDNTTIKFTFPSLDRKTRDEQIARIFHGWVEPGLKSGSVIPSPPIQLQGKGLEQIDPALDALKAGVSGRKVVVSL